MQQTANNEDLISKILAIHGGGGEVCYNAEDSFDVTKMELENIQNDLNELLVDINTFIADNPESDDDGCDCDEFGELDEYRKANALSLLNDTDSDNADGMKERPELNWNTLAPFIQTIVGDLRKLRNLNVMTNDVVKRIKKITEENSDMLQCTENEIESPDLEDSGLDCL